MRAFPSKTPPTPIMGKLPFADPMDLSDPIGGRVALKRRPLETSALGAVDTFSPSRVKEVFTAIKPSTSLFQTDRTALNYLTKIGLPALR